MHSTTTNFERITLSQFCLSKNWNGVFKNIFTWIPKMKLIYLIMVNNSTSYIFIHWWIFLLQNSGRYSEQKSDPKTLFFFYYYYFIRLNLKQRMARTFVITTIYKVHFLWTKLRLYGISTPIHLLKLHTCTQICG